MNTNIKDLDQTSKEQLFIDLLKSFDINVVAEILIQELTSVDLDILIETLSENQ